MLDEGLVSVPSLLVQGTGNHRVVERRGEGGKVEVSVVLHGGSEMRRNSQPRLHQHKGCGWVCISVTGIGKLASALRPWIQDRKEGKRLKER